MPNQTGPKTNKGKAVTRLNATKSGIYSVTPVVPAFEREADWQAHRAGVFDDLQPEGYMQEIIAERIALKTWRLRRLVRYEREQLRHRQQDIPTNLALSAKLDGRKVRENIDKDLQLMDRWAMDALIPGEKELTILMRWEGRLTRELRLDMLHLEHISGRVANEADPPYVWLRPKSPCPPPLPSHGRGGRGVRALPPSRNRWATSHSPPLSHEYERPRE